jgi:sirohydrochlorin ferrochelatase
MTKMRRYGVVLISHGSPSPAWNESQMHLREKVEAALLQNHPLAKETVTAVRWAWLEFAQPDIKAAMDDLEAEGICDRVL